MGSCKKSIIFLIVSTFLLGASSLAFASDWTTTWDALAIAGDYTLWGSYTEPGQNIRIIINASDTLAEGTKVRLTFRGHATNEGEITGAAIGTKKSSSDPWDFNAAPTNITFNDGNESGTLPADGFLVSDEIDFTFDGGTDYLVSIYSTDGDQGYLSWSDASYANYNIGYDDSMTEAPASNYWSNDYIEWLAKIEVYGTNGWETAWDAVEVTGQSPWGDYTAGDRNSRIIVDSAQTSNGGTKVRLTLKGHSASSSQITGASIGPKKASSDPWDFDDTPTNITFNSGNESAVIPTGGVLISDMIDFEFDSTVDYLVAIYSADGKMGYLDQPDSSFYRDGIGWDQTMMVNPSLSYYSNDYIEWLAKIDVYTAAGGDLDGDGYTVGEGDCDDTDPDINPGAAEVCDGIDNNCDAMIDEGVTTTYYQDADGDGYGLLASTVEACFLPSGYSANADDCDDTDAAINPDTVWYEDTDGDGYTTGTTLTQCVQPVGYVLSATAGDCDDTDLDINPGATEICDGIDNNCDATIDEGVTTTYYLDADSDGYGVASTTIQACSLPAGYATNQDDCDDTDPAINPDTVWYEDADGDGYTTGATLTQCVQPAGYVLSATAGDCDDTAAAVNPGATEVCNEIDDNCDSQVDEGVTTTFYLDADGDGYGVASSTVQACSLPSGYATNPDDCDDTDPAINPDTVWYEDADGDGYTTGVTLTQCVQPAGYVLSATAGDCDDTDPDINPGEAEVCDGSDNDCDAMIDDGVTTTYYQDADGDGYGLLGSTVEACSLPAGYAANSDDCDDTDPAINPDTVWYEDTDGDGYTTGTTLTQCVQPAGYVLSAAAGDCDDTDAAIHPGVTEICDGIDNNCDTQVDEGVLVTYYLDGDDDNYGVNTSTTQACTEPAGYADVDGDCDDADASVNPGATEVCDGIDNDCDGDIDPGCLTGITVDPESFTLTGSNPTRQLSVTGYYADGSSGSLTASSTGTAYASSDTNVATVSSEGLVSSVGPGTTVITASNNGFESEASVTVLPVSYEPQPEGSFGSVYEDLVPPNIAIDSYDVERFAVITGMVEDRDGDPIPGVTITVHDHSEYGSVLTDATGRFSIPVNGAKTLSVNYQKTGLLTLQRKVDVTWNDITVAPTVTMLQMDPVTTQVMFTGDPADVTVHQSSEITDVSGTRSLTMVIQGDNRAYTYDTSGNQVFHSIINITTTEFETPESMPAILPPTSGFTYCAALNSDVGDFVEFEKPVVIYVNNFLGFAVSSVTVPVGYYDSSTAQWEPEEDGVVVELLDTDLDGVVDALDYTGDGVADDLDESGSTADDVIGLDDPAVYQPGDTYWRAEIRHFSSIDLNWSVRPLADLVDILIDLLTGPSTDKCPGDNDCKGGDSVVPGNLGSYVEQRSRVLHEDIPVPGTGMTLHYSSDRVPGHTEVIRVPMLGSAVPEHLLKVKALVKIAGRVFESELDPEPDLEMVLEWDGLDYRGKPAKGTKQAYVKVGWVMESRYQTKAGYIRGLRSFGLPGSVDLGIFTRGEHTQWRQWGLDVRSEIDTGLAKGWTLSPHHILELTSPDTLYKGDGTKLSSDQNIMDVIAGTGDHTTSGIPGLAINASIYRPVAVHADKDRNIYIGSADNNIYKIDNDGYITHFAGGGSPPSGNGDGGPATEAVLGYIRDIASDYKGNIYVADDEVIRKIGTDGIIDRYAGGGDPANGMGNGLSATDVWIRPQGITFDDQGNLFATDWYRYRVVKVDPEGVLQTVAGNGYAGFTGDGGQATSARLSTAWDVAVDNNGNVYITDNGRVRKVAVDGIITTIAGNGENVYEAPVPDEGTVATSVPLSTRDLEIDADGNLYMLGFRNSVSRMHIIRIVPDGRLYTVAGAGPDAHLGNGGSAYYASLSSMVAMAMDDGGNIYASGYWQSKVGKISISHTFAGSFDAGYFRFAEEGGIGHVITPTGLHDRTVDLSTGVDLLNFGYTNSRLTSITDRFGNVTAIERDASGNPTSITSPDNITTSLTVDQNGHLTNVTYPDGTYYTMTYTPDGLLRYKTDPEGNTSDHQYDATGRVTDVLDPEGGHWSFDRAFQQDGSALATVSTAEGELISYEDTTSADGNFASLITGPDGSTSNYSLSADGLFADKQTSCGVEYGVSYNTDRNYGYKTVKSSSVAMPSGLSVTTSSSRAYQDTDSNGVPDIITDTVKVNGKTSTVVNATLSGTVTATSPTGRQVISRYNKSTLLTSSISTSGLYDTEFDYDTRGRLKTVSVGNRNTTFTYDTTNGYLDSMTTPDGRVFDYTYDDMGRLRGEDRPDGGQVDYHYDDNGNVIMIVNPNNIAHSFSYTANDQRERYTTPLSGSYIYQYDLDRRLENVQYPSGATITNTWDDGLLRFTDTPEGLISYGYDCGGKLGSVSKGGESTSYTYDGSLLLTDTRAGTVGQTIIYGYNADMQVGSITYAGVTEDFLYDDDGLLTDAGPYTIARNAANGLPESVSDGTVTQGRDFSGYGEVDGVDYTVNGVAAYSWAVSRDNAGRITHREENVGGTPVIWDYIYDLMGRLETVKKDSTTVEAYTYDAQGNRLMEENLLRGVSPARGYSYDSEDKIVWAGPDVYMYDVDGFLTSRTIASGLYSGTATFDYSSRGELLSVSLPAGAGTITYSHDPMGRRIAKSVNSTIVEKYLWQDATTLLAVYDGTDTLLQRFEYADGRMPVAMTAGGQVYYFGYDQVGSLRVVTDNAGTVVKRIDYDSFGSILNDSNPSFFVPFGFAGGLHDRETGLVRFGARDYDPATGRWTAKDPIDFAGGDLNILSYVDIVGKPSIQTNLYLYTDADPINFVDPLGLAPLIGYEDAIGFSDLFVYDAGFHVTIPMAMPLGFGPNVHVNNQGIKPGGEISIPVIIDAGASFGIKNWTRDDIEPGFSGGILPGKYLGIRLTMRKDWLDNCYKWYDPRNIYSLNFGIGLAWPPIPFNFSAPLELP